MAGEGSILDLEPDAFMGALDEMGIYGDQRDYLLREYQNRQSAFSGLFGYLDQANQAVSDRGNRRADILPVEVPQGMSVFDAIKEGTWDWAVPQSAMDAISGTASTVSAPGNILSGVPYTDQQMAETAIGAAGLAQLGGAVSPVPRDAIRSNAPSWFGKKVHQMTPEEQQSWYAASAEMLAAHLDAKSMAKNQGIPISEAIAMQWSKVDPDPVPEANFIHVEEPGDLIDLEGIDYDTEFEPIGGPPSTVLAAPPPYVVVDVPKPSWHGKHILDMTDEEFFNYQDAGSPKSDPNSGIGDADGKTVEQWLNPQYEKNPEEPSAQTTPEDREYQRLLDALQGNGGVPLPNTEAQNVAVQIADLLEKGRGSEVTTEMFDSADFPYLRSLYDAGMTGMTLPMGFKSRMERAAGQGYNTGSPLYRGSGSDHPSSRRKVQTFTSDNPAVAAGYAHNVNDQANIIQLIGRAGSEMPEVFTERGTPWSRIEGDSTVITPDGKKQSLDSFAGLEGRYTSTDTLGRDVDKMGYPGVRINNLVDDASGQWDMYYNGLRHDDPSMIRIDAPNTSNLRAKTALFDPRLMHVRSFLAANASPLTGALGLASQEDDAREQLMRYLNDSENRR